ESAFGFQRVFEDFSNPHSAGVNVEAVELVVIAGVDGFLLGPQHDLVLAEDSGHAGLELGGDALRFQTEVALDGPEVVAGAVRVRRDRVHDVRVRALGTVALRRTGAGLRHAHVDRKSTRLNSSHVSISYAVFCLKKKK